MTNIRGKLGSSGITASKRAFNESPKELHDCLDCEGCICEDFCKEQEEEYFGKKEGDK